MWRISLSGVAYNHGHLQKTNKQKQKQKQQQKRQFLSYHTLLGLNCKVYTFSSLTESNIASSFDI